METAAAAARQHASFALTSLSHRLAKQFAAANGDGSAGNLVFSPLSIYSALSVVAAGAQGRTLRELLDLLGAPSREGLDVNVRGMVDLLASLKEGGPRVSCVSGLWRDSSRFLKPSYRGVTAGSLGSIVRGVNFLATPWDAVSEINGWVAWPTLYDFHSIVDARPVNSDTRLVVVVTNATYFSVIWKTPFDELWTEEGKFHRLDGCVVDANFMYSSKRQFIRVLDGFKVLRMPYDVSVPRDTFGGMPCHDPTRDTMGWADERIYGLDQD